MSEVIHVEVEPSGHRRNCPFLLIAAVQIAFPGTAGAAQGKGEAAAELLDHANTYYWLARARGNSVVDLKKATRYAEAVEDLLDGSGTPKTVSFFRGAEQLLDYARTQEKAWSYTMMNVYPLYDFLLGREKFYVFRGNPVRRAAGNAVSALVDTYAGRWKTKDNLPFVVVVTDPVDHVLEEIVHRQLNAKTNCYAISPLELGRTLDATQWKSLYDFPPPASTMENIARAFDRPAILLITVARNDVVDDVYYYGATSRRWAASNGEFAPFEYADGFSQDLRRREPLAIGFLVFVIFVSLIASLVFRYLAKTDASVRQDSVVPAWTGPAACTLALAICFAALFGFGKISPSGDAYWLETRSLLWLLGMGLLFSMLPLGVIYLSSIRITSIRTRLHNRDTLAAMAFGSLSAAPAICGFYSTLEFGLVPTMPLVLFWLVFVGIASQRIGASYSLSVTRHSKTAAAESATQLVFVYVVCLLGMFWNTSLMIGSCVAVSVLSWGLWPAIKKSKEWMKNRSQPQDPRDEYSRKESEGIDWLIRQIEEPEKYIVPRSGILGRAIDFIVKNKDEKLEVIYIEAGEGCGKTRIANEIARRIKEREEKAIVLFGDCDEFPEQGTSVPYEPFAQALGEYVGIGRFEDPSERAQKIQTGLRKIGMDTAMGAVGLGAVSSLLEASGGDEEKESAATTNEIAYAMQDCLTKLASQGRVIFILDDLQWMDESTHEVFEKLFTNLMRDFTNNELCFIFTARPAEAEPNPAVAFLQSLVKEKKINVFPEIREETLLNEHILSQLLESIKFEYDSREKLVGFFEDRDIFRPLHVLETIKTLVNRGLVDTYAGSFVLRNEADLRSLPNPKHFVALVKRQLEGFDEKVSEILQCAALIGMRFRANVLAHIYKIDRIELLQMLRKAEDGGIIRDVLEIDDEFEFTSKNFVSVLHEIARVSKHAERLPQMAKEYHRRLVDVTMAELEKKHGNVAEASLSELTGIARRAYLVRDVIPVASFDLNLKAGTRNHAVCRFSDAIGHFQNALATLNLIRSADEVQRIELMASMSECFLDAGRKKEEVDAVLKEAESLCTQAGERLPAPLQARLTLIRMLNDYQHARPGTDDFKEAARHAEKLMAMQGIPAWMTIRGKFYAALCFPPSERDKKRAVLGEVLDELDKAFATESDTATLLELEKVKSEALNSMGFVLLYGGDPADGEACFREALAINGKPGINDLKGTAIAHGGLGDCLKKRGQDGEAVEHYKKNLEISQANGDTRGIIRMTSQLGDIERVNGRKQEAMELFRKSFSVARQAGNNDGKVFAAAGILNTAIDMGSEEDVGKAIKTVAEIVPEVSSAGKFAKDQMRAALGRVPDQALLKKEGLQDLISSTH